MEINYLNYRNSISDRNWGWGEGMEICASNRYSHIFTFYPIRSNIFLLVCQSCQVVGQSETVHHRPVIVCKDP